MNIFRLALDFYQWTRFNYSFTGFDTVSAKRERAKENIQEEMCETEEFWVFIDVNLFLISHEKWSLMPPMSSNVSNICSSITFNATSMCHKCSWFITLLSIYKTIDKSWTWTHSRQTPILLYLSLSLFMSLGNHLENYVSFLSYMFISHTTHYFFFFLFYI